MPSMHLDCHIKKKFVRPITATQLSFLLLEISSVDLFYGPTIIVYCKYLGTFFVL